MSMSVLTVLQMMQTFAAYSCVTLLLPFLLLRKRLEFFELPERLIGYFLVGNFYIIYVVFLLQFLHISYPITLRIATILPFIIVVWKKYRNPLFVGIGRLLRTFLHLLRGELGFKTLVKNTTENFSHKYSKTIRAKLWHYLPDILLGILIIAGVLYVYGYNTVTVYGYKASDVPVHNFWINEMDSNRIFSQGVYPHGFHCVIYYLHAVFGIKTYVILRVFCITQTIFIHFALLVSLKVICKSRFAPYFGTAAYLMLKIYSSGSYVRFTSALPQEYGMLFILPAGVLAMRFFQEYALQIKAEDDRERTRRRKRVKGYLYGFTVSFSLTLTVHFYDTIPAGILCVGIAAGFFIFFVRWRYFWRIMLAGIISVVLAVVPMAIGVVMGHPLQGSLYWALGVMNGEEKETAQNDEEKVTKIVDKNGNIVTVVGEIDEETLLKIVGGDQEEEGIDTSEINTTEDEKLNLQETQIKQIQESKIQKLFQLLKSKALIIFDRIKENCANTGNITTAIMLIAIASLFPLGMVMLIRKHNEYAYVLWSFAVFMVFMCIMQALRALGLPELMQQYRVCIFFCYSMGVIWALDIDALIYFLSDIANKKQILSVGSSVVLLISAIFSAQNGLIRLPVEKYAMELNESIFCLTEIMHDNKKLNWTIVSANDERQMIAESGWHYEMITFLRQLENLKENSVILIPTEYVYFFIEKRPVNLDEDGVVSGENLPLVSKKGASQPVSKAAGIKAYEGEARWGTMSHMYYWAQAFQKLYPEEMEVYYETENFVCYRLRQNVNSLYNLAIDYGYNDPTEEETEESVGIWADNKEEMNGFAQELRSYYDYHGDRLFFISTFEHGKGELEQLSDK